MMHEIDVLIVGVGLAGSLLAMELEKMGLNYLIVSDDSKSQSTAVAGGVYNPFSFTVLKKDWRADDFLASMYPTYKYIEQITNSQFFYDLPITKYFDRVVDESEFATLKPFIKEVDGDALNKGLKPTAFDLTFHSTGYIDANIFLSSTKQFFLSRNRLMNHDFIYDELIMTDKCAQWKNFNARKVVFCDGRHAIDNPWFPTAALALTKGELLVIDAPDLKLSSIAKNILFMLPLGGSRYKVGATYHRETIDEKCSVLGREWLIKHLDDMLDVSYTIVDQLAGIRPNVRDRKPIIGFHPTHENIGFFNGLGSKGFLQGPFCAQQLAQHIMTKDSLILPEIDVKRFDKNRASRG